MTIKSGGLEGSAGASIQISSHLDGLRFDIVLSVVEPFVFVIGVRYIHIHVEVSQN